MLGYLMLDFKSIGRKSRVFTIQPGSRGYRNTRFSVQREDGIIWYSMVQYHLTSINA